MVSIDFIACGVFCWLCPLREIKINSTSPGLPSAWQVRADREGRECHHSMTATARMKSSPETLLNRDGARLKRDSGGELKQHHERLDHRSTADLRAPDFAIALFAQEHAVVLCGRREMHQADRFPGRSTTRARDAGDRNGEIHRR